MFFLSGCSHEPTPKFELDSLAGYDVEEDSKLSEEESEQDIQESDLPMTPFPWSEEGTDETCSDNVDNNHNGYVDCDDFSCSRNLAVEVCGSDSRYENSAEFCSNSIDDDNDGLADCLDPDCYKNPFHHVCENIGPEGGCGSADDLDGDGYVGCDDYDCLLGDFDCDLGARKRVLFDQTLDETASGGGGSDWVIDGLNGWPQPSNPEEGDEWNGSLSSFGFDLLMSGQYLVESLPSHTGTLSYNDSANLYDLSRYDVLVLFEPSRQMSRNEKNAIIQFVISGGGLLMVANHVGADRDGNGFSAPQVFNDMMEDNDIQEDPFGFLFDEVDLEVEQPLETISNTEHPVISGPIGEVNRIGFYFGCSARITDTNSTAKGLIFLNSLDDESMEIVVGVSEVGSGRVVFVTDSAIGGDGTDSHGNTRTDHDSWRNSSLDNSTLFLNSIFWLSGE